LERENKIITEKLIKNAKESFTLNVNLNNIPSSNNNLNNIAIPARDGKEDTSTIINNISNNTSYIKDVSCIKDINKTKNSNYVLAPGSTKVITKKIIREMIDDICESKLIFDKRCVENKIPKETMEQYMYTYLNQKYGLKV